jgi:hypothetical protein
MSKYSDDYGILRICYIISNWKLSKMHTSLCMLTTVYTIVYEL